MSSNAKTYLYAGPSLSPAVEQRLANLPHWILCPPVKRGDLPARSLQATDRVVLADGLFHQQLAVGHIEIRKLIQEGVVVWGVSSMGAIRAFEMRHMGMQGFGQVYDYFYEYPDFQDDEVTLLHEAEHPYKPVSEPLVHLRYCLAQQVKAGLLSPAQQEAITTDLKARWYGARSLGLFARLLEQQGFDPTALLHDFDPYRIKQHDLLSLINYLSA